MRTILFTVLALAFAVPAFGDAPDTTNAAPPSPKRSRLSAPT